MLIEKISGWKIDSTVHITGFATGMAFAWLNAPNKVKATNSPLELPPIDLSNSQSIEASKVANISTAIQ